MIFRQHEEVLSGVKSQTRRLVKEDDFAGNMHGRVVPDDVWGNRIDTVYDKNGRVRWQVGRTYAVQPGRGKKAVGRIRITKIRRERVREISKEDVFAEGVGIPIDGKLYPITVPDVAVEQFARLWNSICKKQGTRFEDDPETWALTFETI